MHLSSYLLAAAGIGLLLACVPYVLLTGKRGFSVRQRTLFALGLYTMAAGSALLLLQLWVNWQFVLVTTVFFAIAIPVFTLAEWWRHRRQVAHASQDEQLAEKARLDGDLQRARFHEQLAQMTRKYYGERFE